MSRHIDILRDLVSIASTTGNEQTIARYVMNYCKAPNVEITKLQNNVAILIPGKNRQKSFILTAHIDTVAVSEHWETDPYILTSNKLDPDKLHGLGASDNKAGVALLMDLVVSFAKHQPDCDMFFLFTEGEEDDNIGARHVARWLDKTKANYDTTGGIVIEPTNGGEFIGIGHRNGLTLDIVARGKGGHGSQFIDDGDLALEKLSHFIADALPQMRKDWGEKYADSLLGLPTLNATKLNAGREAHNVIPTTATLTLDFRSTPALDEALPSELTLLEDTYNVKILSPRKPDPALCPQGAYILDVVRSALPSVPLRAFPGATDLPYFLAHGTPTVILGPGDMAAMHQPNEWVKVSDIVRCEKMIRKIIKAF